MHRAWGRGRTRRLAGERSSLSVVSDGGMWAAAVAPVHGSTGERGAGEGKEGGELTTTGELGGPRAARELKAVDSGGSPPSHGSKRTDAQEEASGDSATCWGLLLLLRRVSRVQLCAAP